MLKPWLHLKSHLSLCALLNMVGRDDMITVVRQTGDRRQARGLMEQMRESLPTYNQAQG